MATVNKTKEFLLNLLFPRFCLGCQKEGDYLCQDCKSTLEISEYYYCLCNHHPLRLPDGGKCKKCRSKKLSGLYFPLSYKEKSLTRKILHQFKYQPYIKELAKTLSSLIIDHFLLSDKNYQKIFENGILVPVPLDKKKLKNRGFNQAEEIAKELSQILKIPLIANNLVKIKRTPDQIELSQEQRQENLKNAFLCKNPKEVKNKKIFLIDDVYTTGSTLEECALTLKSAGAKEVWGIVVAREG